MSSFLAGSQLGANEVDDLALGDLFQFEVVGQGHGELKLLVQHFKHGREAFLTALHQAPHNRALNKHGICAIREGLDNVCAAADTIAEVDLDVAVAVTDGRSNHLEHLDSRGLH